MRPPSRGRQRRRGQRFASRGGPGQADSTRPLAEKVSLLQPNPTSMNHMVLQPRRVGPVMRAGTPEGRHFLCPLENVSQLWWRPISQPKCAPKTVHRWGTLALLSGVQWCDAEVWASFSSSKCESSRVSVTTVLICGAEARTFPHFPQISLPRPSSLNSDGRKGQFDQSPRRVSSRPSDPDGGGSSQSSVVNSCCLLRSLR